MKQAIVIFIKNREIEAIRKKYDPFHKKFRTHITLTFLFEDIPQKQLYEHIKKSIKGIKPFRIILKGIKKSPKEYCLYLLIKKGKIPIIRIHKKLYSKLLTKWLRKEIPYLPHVTLGVLKNRSEIHNAIKEINKKKIEVEVNINKIYLLTLKKDNTIRCIKRFKLK